MDLLEEQLKALFPQDLNKQNESFSVSPGNGCFMIIMPLKLLHWLIVISPWRMAQSTVSWKAEQMSHVFPNVTEKWPFWDHLATNYCTGLKLHILGEWLKGLSPRRMPWTSVSQRPEQMRLVFASVTEKWPFQDHLGTKTIIMTQSSVPQENGSKLCLPETWTNEQSLPQCHQEMAFSRQSCH